MAEKIDDVRVTMGKAVRVKNTNRRHHSEAKQYWALWVEDESGDNERCILLTNTELYNVRYAHFPNCADLKLGRVYVADVGGFKYNLCRVEQDGVSSVRTFSKTVLRKGALRAENNPEDVPERGFLADLLD